MLAPLRDTGLDVVGVMPWGSHCCHFFRTQQDLLETLVPYSRRAWNTASSACGSSTSP
jgi:hypothetical protein